MFRIPVWAPDTYTKDLGSLRSPSAPLRKSAINVKIPDEDYFAVIRRQADSELHINELQFFRFTASTVEAQPRGDSTPWELIVECFRDFAPQGYHSCKVQN